MVLCFQNYSQTYTETGAFSIQRFRTLFKNTIANGNNKQVLKGFQRYTDILKNMEKIIMKSFKCLIIIYPQYNFDQIGSSFL